MPGNDKIVVKKSEIFLAALAPRPQYFGLIKNAWRICKRPPDALQFRVRNSRNVSAVTAEPRKTE
jgi:hypothetical protein